MKWLTAKDIASDLQMSEDFIYKNVLRFGGEKFGYSWRFPPDAIERYRQSVRPAYKNAVRLAVPVRKDGPPQDVQPGDLPDEAGGGEGGVQRRRSVPKDREDPFGFEEYRRKRQALTKKSR